MDYFQSFLKVLERFHLLFYTHTHTDTHCCYVFSDINNLHIHTSLPVAITKRAKMTHQDVCSDSWEQSTRSTVVKGVFLHTYCKISHC